MKKSINFTFEMEYIKQEPFLLDQKLYDYNQINNSLRNEVIILRIAVTNLGQDKEKLLIEIDKKITENETLKKELDIKRKTTDDLTAHICDLETRLHKTNEEFKEKLKESNLIKLQLERTNEVNSDLNRLYDSILKDNKRLQDDMVQLNKNNQRLNCELVKLNANNISLCEKFENLKIEYQKQLSACQEYDVKLSGINLGLQNFEKTFKSLQKENRELARDLLNSRKLNERLEQAEEFLMKQITSKELDFNKLHAYLAERRNESHLKAALIKDERLEDLIASNREKDFQYQLSAQEKDSKIKFYKLKLINTEQKLIAQSKEISCLKNHLHDVQHENEHLLSRLKCERAEHLKRVNEAYQIF